MSAKTHWEFGKFELLFLMLKGFECTFPASWPNKKATNNSEETFPLKDFSTFEKNVQFRMIFISGLILPTLICTASYLILVTP